MWFELGLLLFTASLVHWIRWRGFFSKAKQPPSFYGLPLVGIVPYLALQKNHIKVAEHTVEKYGPVFRFRLCNSDVIMVNKIDAVKEVLKSDDFLGRPSITPFQIVSEVFDALPFAMLENEQWRTLRNASVHALRDLGFGKTPKMEAKIQEEASVFLDELDSSNGAPYDPKESLMASVSNNIATLIFGDRLAYSHPKRRCLNEFLSSFTVAVSATALFSFVPYSLKILSFLGMKAVKQVLSTSKQIYKIFENETQSHMENFSDSDKRDFMDHMIAQQKINPDVFHARANRGSYFVLFGAGSNTTRIAVEYLLQVMASFPQLQEQVYQEIEKEIGTSRLPTWVDHDKLNLVNAVIAERMRIFPIVPFGVFRRALRDTKIQGFDVKKGTVVIYNINSVHHDPSVFTNPDEFNPARFLDSAGKFVPNNNIISFAIGKRACPGETFAVFELFLYFAAIVQRFRVEPVDGAAVRLTKATQFISEPEPQQLRFISRN